MQIINNNQSPYFGCIRIKNGGMDFLKKEGTQSLNILEKAKDNCKLFKWHLEINPEGYSLLSPKNYQIYNGPFTARKHLAKGKLAILMKNKNGNIVSYNINYGNKEKVSLLYKEIKKLSGLEKMIKILTVLEDYLR